VKPPDPTLLPLAYLQPLLGLGTGMLGSLASPPGGLTLLSGIIDSLHLLAPLGVSLS
jgi:hypothetical protein